AAARVAAGRRRRPGRLPASGAAAGLLGGGEADGARHAGAAQPAVAVGHLVQVLLVVALGEVEGPGRGDLGGDLAVAGGGQHLLVAIAGRLGGRPLDVVDRVDRRPVL